MLSSRQQAVTTVTFALIAPVFFLIVFGTMEMGRVFNNWMVITNEAREAARYGAVIYDGTQDFSSEQTAEQKAVTAYLANRLNGVLDQHYMTAYVTLSQDPRPKIQVRINYQVPLVIPLVSQLLPNPFPIAAQSAMQGE